MLTDNVLLEIFDFYRENYDYPPPRVWKWHVLVHVCQTWRQIIFASPHRLNLQILCTNGTPVRKHLCIWPAFPIVIDYYYSGSSLIPNDEDNVTAALEHPDRVCYLEFNITGSQLRELAKVMQKPFLVLTHLTISSEDGNALALPARFLGGSTPCLQKIFLSNISFLALPMLLLSANDLVRLNLCDIPWNSYVSPEVMVVGLAALPRLKYFTIEFQSEVVGHKVGQWWPDRIRPPPPVTRTALPALRFFQFKGSSEYLEDLVAQIEGPLLKQIFVDYMDRPVDSQVARFFKFVDCSVGHKSTPFSLANVCLFSGRVAFTLYCHANYPDWDRHSICIIISCEEIDWQAFATSYLARLLGQFSATLSTVVHLELEVQLDEDHQLEGTDYGEWLHPFRRFSTVQDTACISGARRGRCS